MPVTPVDIVIDRGRGMEAHMMGSSVGVCWNIKRVRVKSDNPMLETYEFKRGEHPHISFISVRDYGERNGGKCIDEDCSVEGGISIRNAIEIQAELALAVQYISEMN